MFTRTGWTFAALTLILLVVGKWLNYVELVMLALTFFLCLIFAGIWLLLRPHLEVKREVSPSRVSEGEGAAGVLNITNVGSRRCPPLLAVEHFTNREIAVSLPGLAPGGNYSGTYMLPAERRGYYAVGPLRIGHSDPLRLISVTQTHGSQATLWVHPRVSRVAPVPTGHSQDLEGPTSAGAPRGGIAFHSLREYVPGDDLRLIHWKSTARLDKLMVRHTVITNEPKILVVLDTSAASYEEDFFEDAVRVAASLINACANKKFPTELRTTGGVMGTIDPTGLGWMDVLDKLAAVQATTGDPGLHALTGMASKREQGVSLGVVTGQPTRDMAEAIGRVRGRFQATTFVQVGEKFDRPPMHITGAFGISASTSDDFAAKWKLRVG